MTPRPTTPADIAPLHLPLPAGAPRAADDTAAAEAPGALTGSATFAELWARGGESPHADDASGETASDEDAPEGELPDDAPVDGPSEEEAAAPAGPGGPGAFAELWAMMGDAVEEALSENRRAAEGEGDDQERAQNAPPAPEGVASGESIWQPPRQATSAPFASPEPASVSTSPSPAEAVTPGPPGPLGPGTTAGEPVGEADSPRGEAAWASGPAGAAAERRFASLAADVPSAQAPAASLPGPGATGGEPGGAAASAAEDAERRPVLVESADSVSVEAPTVLLPTGGEPGVGADSSLGEAAWASGPADAAAERRSAAVTADARSAEAMTVSLPGPGTTGNAPGGTSSSAAAAGPRPDLVEAADSVSVEAPTVLLPAGGEPGFGADRVSGPVGAAAEPRSAPVAAADTSSVEAATVRLSTPPTTGGEPGVGVDSSLGEAAWASGPADAAAERRSSEVMADARSAEAVTVGLPTSSTTGGEPGFGADRLSGPADAVVSAEVASLPGPRVTGSEPGGTSTAEAGPRGAGGEAGDASARAGVVSGPGSPQGKARRRGPADPVRQVMHRHQALIAGAVDVWEVAAGLEAHGVTDVDARRLRHRDVFGLAEELYARVPRSGQVAEPVQGEREGAWLHPLSAARYLLPGAVCAVAGRFLPAEAVTALVLVAAYAVLRRGPLHAPGRSAALWVCALLALTSPTAPGLAASLVPAAYGAHWFAVRAHAQLAPSHGLDDFADAVRPRLAAVLAGYAAVLVALLSAAGPVAAPAALGLLLFATRLLSLHGRAASAAVVLGAACAAEALYRLAAALGPGGPHAGAHALICGAAAAVAIVLAFRTLSRAAAHRPT